MSRALVEEERVAVEERRAYLKDVREEAEERQEHGP